MHRLVHHFNPSRVRNGFGKTFQLSNYRHLRHLHHEGITKSANGVLSFQAERRSFSSIVVSVCLAPGVLMIGISNPPYSLSSECTHSFPFESSNSNILAFPLSDFGLGINVLWSLGGSSDPLNLVETGLSSGVSLSQSCSSDSMSRSASISSDGAESTVYQDVDSSNTTSLLTRTFLVEELKHLFIYPFCSSEYPTRIHFSDLGSSF